MVEHSSKVINIRCASHTAAEEAGAILASALTRLARAQSGEKDEPAAHKQEGAP